MITDPVPQPLYDSAAHRLPLLRELQDLYQYRELFFVLVDKTFKTRYKRSSLGILWTLLNPLLTTIVLSIAFSHFFRLDTPNYPIFLLSGLLAWNFFAQTSQYAIHTLIWGSTLLKRIYVPRTIFMLAIVGNGLVNMGFALLVLLAMMLVMRHPWSWALLTLPLGLLLLAVFTTGITLLLGTAAVFSADLLDVISVAWQVLFYLTPVIYPLETLPPMVRWVVSANPVTYFVLLLRQPVYFAQFPAWHIWLIATLIALASLFLGAHAFTKNSSQLAYEL